MGKIAHLLENRQEVATFSRVLAGVVEAVKDASSEEIDKLSELQGALEAKIDGIPEFPVSDINQRLDSVAAEIRTRIEAIKFPEFPKPQKAEKLDLTATYKLFEMQSKALDELKSLVVDLAAREYEVNIPDDRPREWEFDCKQVPSGYKITAKAK